ncbi:hypothetical protein SAMN05660860_03218 [Geoalkalibacter ferrihydriticus]|uniref:Uncharacterized protein n=2 Tax=Geoalkalibacter ferrihydriticus TaxID=392333 RepID=A0A0C2HZL4_9BACT|nr:hypothetical protein [Geoalkalibacter ferrihydriticus]KIH78147.1 hypothetical protein GFER_06170 [Geoalkalibacter ferrihydriticus DSM 17813]SDM81310.1 hypothetical protein SAMN05660860_03218 [Geoalkalibacter ferrihydriticus]
MSQEKKKTLSRKGWVLVGILAAALVMTAVWRWTPVQEHVTPDALADWAETIRGSSYTPLILMAIGKTIEEEREDEKEE